MFGKPEPCGGCFSSYAASIGQGYMQQTNLAHNLIYISGFSVQGMEAAKAASEAAEAAVAAEQEAVEELRGRAAKLDAEVAELRKATVKQNDAGGHSSIHVWCAYPFNLCSNLVAGVRVLYPVSYSDTNHHLCKASCVDDT